MSTHSLIGIKLGEKVLSVYCHFDGYPEGVGQTLLSYYDTADKVEALMTLGDLSSLSETFEETRKESYNVRDGEETEETQAVFYESVQKFRADGQSHNYLFIPEENVWYEVQQGARLVSLESILNPTDEEDEEESELESKI